MKGLVLEGGAMRGMYTAGVLDVLLKNGISFDTTVGVSAGAVFGCSFHSKQYGRAIRYNKKYCRDKRYMSLKSLILTGNLFGEQFCYHDIPERLDPFDTKTFEENPGKFYVVTTDVKTGKPIYHLCKDGGEEDIEWMRASASLPLVSKIVKTEGYEMLDGGISDSIPVEWMISKGANKIVLVLTREKGYRKEKNPAMPVIKFLYRKYPQFIEACESRYIVYNKTLELVDKLEKEGKVFVIRPEKNLGISKLEKNPENLQIVYDKGKSDMEKQMDNLKKYFKIY